MAISDGGCPGTALVMPHRRCKGKELPDWKQAHNQVRARVEHVFPRMTAWKILCACRLKGDGVHHARRGIARLHNLNLAEWSGGRTGSRPLPHPAKDHLRDKP
jgi:hypothetical protein